VTPPCGRSSQKGIKGALRIERVTCRQEAKEEGGPKSSKRLIEKKSAITKTMTMRKAYNRFIVYDKDPPGDNAFQWIWRQEMDSPPLKWNEGGTGSEDRVEVLKWSTKRDGIRNSAIFATVEAGETFVPVEAYITYV
jgi:hypothetical protein